MASMARGEGYDHLEHLDAAHHDEVEWEVADADAQPAEGGAAEDVEEGAEGDGELHPLEQHPRRPLPATSGEKATRGA